jgi:demethylmenaquinone methyltransferase/2-methoxy-6-polyprenyl-1,4-benzoquinol methylase
MLTERNRTARAIFRELPSRYDRLAEVLSLGQNRRWQRAMLRPVMAARPTRCLDIASGTGSVAIKLADPSAGADGTMPSRPHVFAIDLTPEMVFVGRKRAAEAGVDIAFVIARAEELPFRDGSFESATFTYLLRYVEDPVETLKEIVRVVRPGGVVSSLEFFVPPLTVFRGLWVIYTRIILPAFGRVFGREWSAVGRFLGPSITEHYRRFPLEDHLRAWQDAGIRSARYRVMSLGGGLIMWGTKK